MSIKPGYPINKIFMIYFIIVYYIAKNIPDSILQY